MIAFVLCGGVLLPAGLRLQVAPPDSSVFSQQRYVPDDERLAGIIRAFTTEGDTLAIWGWAPRLYVASRLPQGTRDGNAARQIQHSDKRDSYYRPRFIDDLRRNRPAVFVDAVGPGRFDFRHREHQAHDAFADMAAHVRTNYTLVGDFYNTRLYLRSDLPALRPEATRRMEEEIHRCIADGSAQWHWPLPEAAFPTRHLFGRHTWHMQTPAEYVFGLRGDERAFYFSFGLDPRCYVQGTTDGAELLVELRGPDQPPRLLFRQHLDPRNVPADRGLHRGHVLLPPVMPAGSSLAIRALPGTRGDMSWDWVFFGEPRFARALDLSSRP